MTDLEDDDDPQGDEYIPSSGGIDAVGLVIEGFFSLLELLAHLVP